MYIYIYIYIYNYDNYVVRLFMNKVIHMHLNPFAHTEFRGHAVEYPLGVKVSWVSIPASRIARV